MARVKSIGPGEAIAEYLAGNNAPRVSRTRCSLGDECRRHAFAASRRILPELCLISRPSDPRGRREGRVLTSHPRSAARRCSAKRPHNSIQVVPITRPSLRSGLTAYAVLSREPIFPLASLALAN